MNVDVRIESADLKGALTTRTSSGTCTLRSAGSQQNLDASASASRTSQEPAIFRMRPAASRLSFFRPAVDRNLYIAVGLATERIGRTFEGQLDWSLMVGAVRHPKTAASGARKRRFK
jgi:hypothetical protein